MREKTVLVLLALLVSSCESQSNNSNLCEDSLPKVEKVIVFAPSTMMVCHNPESKSHHRLCTPECYEDGNNTAYCYELPTDLCNEGWHREAWIDAICEELTETL